MRANHAEPDRRQRQLNEAVKGALRIGRTRRVRWASPASRASRTRVLSATAGGQFREGDKLIDIVRQPLDERNAITDLANAYVPTRAIPFR